MLNCLLQVAQVHVINILYYYSTLMVMALKKNGQEHTIVVMTLDA